MRSTDGFREFVIEQLSRVRDLVPKAMFGGVGFYSGDVFFGILARNQLYLKVGDLNRAAFDAVGSEAFKPYADRPMAMRYRQVPADVLEDADELLQWARAAIVVAQEPPPRRKHPAAKPASRKPGKVRRTVTRPRARPGRKRGV